jgi:hypothetical protein
VHDFLGTVRRRAVRLLFLPPVLFWMLVVEITLRWVSLPTLSKRLGVPLDSTTERSNGIQPDFTLTRWQAGQLRTLAPVAARWPFADGPCLRQSIVAGHVLRRHRPVLRLGVASPSEGLQAHAWVEVGGVSMGESSKYTLLINTPMPPDAR